MADSGTPFSSPDSRSASSLFGPAPEPSSTRTTAPAAPTPRRGGVHPLGIYNGGSAIDKNYALVSPGMSFKFAAQLRTAKQTSSNEKTLMDQQDNSQYLKFKGKLDMANVGTSELDKDQFMTKVKKNMKYYGLQTWFYLPDDDGIMRFLLTDIHLFTLDKVMTEFKSRLTEPLVVIGASTGVETTLSQKRRLRCYDCYELWDMAISRLAVESLVGIELRDKIEVRYSHIEDFDDLPGQIFYMMVMETCHASTAMDVDSASTAYEKLNLKSYAGENVGALATDALRHIKVMQTAYAIPVTVGSSLLRKVSETSSTFFNSNVHVKLNSTLTMERKYKVLNPKDMLNDPSYRELGPVALCGYLQDEYGLLVTDKDWPALTAAPPQSNLSPIIDTSGSQKPPKTDDTNKVKNAKGHKCFDCQSEYHLRGNSACPNFGGERRPKVDRENGDTPRPRAPWKYIKPADISNVITDQNGKTWKFCTKCVCKLTGKVGFYNQYHDTAGHTDRGGGGGAAAAAAAAAAAGPPAGTGAPQANLSPSSYADAAKAKATGTVASEDILIDDNALEFDGLWMKSSNHQAYLTSSVPDPEWDAMVTAQIEQDMDQLLADMLENPSSEDSSSAGSVNSDVSRESEDNTTVKSSEASTADLVYGACNKCEYCGPFGVDCKRCDRGSFMLPLPSDSEDDSSVPAYGGCTSCTQVGLWNTVCVRDGGVFKNEYIKPPKDRMAVPTDVNKPDNYMCPADAKLPVDTKPSFSTTTKPSTIDVEGELISPMQDLNSPSSTADNPTNAVLHLYLAGCLHLPQTIVSCRGLDMNVFLLLSYLALTLQCMSWVPSCRLQGLTHLLSSNFYAVTSFMLVNVMPEIGFQVLAIHAYWVGFPVMCSLLSQGFQLVRLLGFFLTTLCWDGIECLLTPAPAPSGFLTSRRARRTKLKSPFIRAYPRHWLMLTGFLACDSHRLVHPFTLTGQAIQDTWLRTLQLDSMVDLSSDVLLQLSGQRFRACRKTFNPIYEFHESLIPSFQEEEIYYVDHLSDAETPSLADSEDSTSLFDSSFDDTDEGLESELTFFDAMDTAPLPTECDLAEPWSQAFFFDGVMDVDDNDEYFPCNDDDTWVGWQRFNMFQWIDDLTHLESSMGVQSDHFIDCSSALTEESDSSSLSPAAYNASLGGPLYNPLGLIGAFPVIFDSGASKAISGFKEDFVKGIKGAPAGMTLGGMADGMAIAGEGLVQWTFFDGKHNLTLMIRCFYVPKAKVRILSPQCLFDKRNGNGGTYVIGEPGIDDSVLKFDSAPPLCITYDEATNLPVGIAKNQDTLSPQCNMSIMSEENQNLTPSQRLLLHWHYRFGHRGFQLCQFILSLPPFGSERFKGTRSCIAPKCEICQKAHGHRSPTKGSVQKINDSTAGALKDGNLNAGDRVSVDHFECSLKGRTYTSFGKTTSEQYKGSMIFVDHMSSYLHVEHQLGFSAVESIRAKQNFEQFALDSGVVVQKYLADNGAFKAKDFVQHIREHEQSIHYCGVNAHHKNGVAERSIRTVSDTARAMILHSAAHWKNGIEASVWPMAVDYACYVYNHLPKSNGVAPADLFLGSTVPRHKLKDLHVFGCPVYVLDPKLQSGKKLPRWQPRSRRGVFVGFSSRHSSDVPLVLNLQTGSISPQYHVVFDDDFSTVCSVSESEEPPDFWTIVDLDDYTCRIPVDTDSNPELQDDWLTPPELEEKRRREIRLSRIRDATQTTQAVIQSSPSDLPSDQPRESRRVSFQEESPSKIDTNVGKDSPGGATVPVQSDDPNLQRAPGSSPSGTPSPTVIMPRRSQRANKGSYSTTRYINEAYLSSVKTDCHDSQEAELAYRAELSTDLESGIMRCVDPRAYLAKGKKSDPDNPSFNEAMLGEHADEYRKAMVTEINQLLRQRTWDRVDRASIPNGPDGKPRRVLPGTWAFKLKRLPDGTPLKFKARYCVRGDLQKEGIDYFDTYAPVVQWSTIRMVLSLILHNGWTTKQVDYTNAFAQADLEETVYIDQPRGFSGVTDKATKVLHLLKSLYGLKQAPRTFYQKLRTGLEERGFTCSQIDPCLFMKKDLICICYVDDTIMCGPDPDAIEREIKSLGVRESDHVHSFMLRDEGEVGDFLGIHIEKQGEGKFTLTQTGLIEKVIKATGMEKANSCRTPSSTTPLGLDKEGSAHEESWDYASVVGMLMYLANNSRPDIAYAVNQCARFTHSPRASHTVGIKRIIRYLRGSRTKGMTLQPSDEFNVDCYVDADFAGLYNIENDQDPICVKSRTGYLITFMGCPLLWRSKIQSLIALSTMEAEYIALSMSMRELIPIREIIKEIKSTVFREDGFDPKLSSHSKTFIPTSKVYEDNEACLKFATMPKMSPRTKHIALPYHFFRSKVEELEVNVIGIGTLNQLADQFTKGLPEPKFETDRKRLMGW